MDNYVDESVTKRFYRAYVKVNFEINSNGYGYKARNYNGLWVLFIRFILFGLFLYITNDFTNLVSKFTKGIVVIMTYSVII